VEGEQLGGATRCAARERPGFFDQALAFDQAAEIRLMQPEARESLDRFLQLQKRETVRHQLEHHGAVFDFGAQPRQRRRQNSPMIVQRSKIPAKPRGAQSSMEEAA